MGKKQKMKKAAAKAVAAAKSSTNASNNNNNNKNNKNENENKKETSINDKTKDDNIQKLLSLAKKIQSMPSGSAAPKLAKCHSPSSGSGSSATDSDDCETTKEYDSDDIDDYYEDADSTLVMQDANPTLLNTASNLEDNDDDDAITLVQKASPGCSPVKPEVLTIPKYSRGEKKARRLLMKLDLERIPNVSRVTMRKAKNVLLCMDQPDVYKCPHTQTLILFGEVRVEDTSNAAAAQAAERYLNDVHVCSAESKNLGEGLNSKLDDDEDDAQLDNGQLDEKDIQLVIMQSSCSRQKAIKALLKHNADVVNAIMELTIG